MAAWFCLLIALVRVTISEICNSFHTISDHGISYAFSHWLCALYVTFKTKTTPLKNPIPEPVIEELNAERAGFFHSDHEWEQERPKSNEHLKEKEDTLLIQGSNIRSGASLILRLSRLRDGLCEVFVLLQLNKEEVLVMQNNIRLDLSDKLSYYGCGLKLECLAPMRRWRLCFNGLMKNKNNEDVHVKFGGIWITGSHTVEHPLEVPVSTMSDLLSHLSPLALASQLDSIYKNEYFFSQYGRMDLEIFVGKNDPVELHLWGSRINLCGKRTRRTEYHRFAHFRLGHRFHIMSHEVANNTVHFGSLYDPVTKAYPITKTDVSGDHISVSNNFETFHLQIGKLTLEPVAVPTTRPMVGDNFLICALEASLNGEEGVVVTLRIETHERPTLCVPPEYKHHLADEKKIVAKLCLSTSDEDCKRTDLTGGKGSSLAVLTTIAKQFGTFTVPRAIVLTTTAYEKFSKVREVREAIQDLCDTIRRNPKSQELKAACEACVRIVEASSLPSEIVAELKQEMSVFGGLDDLRFAVRSSAVGEDSEEMSAAGQMTTFLGVRGTDFEGIITSVAKCWASQFSFTAVKYKRQYGQLIASKMAVVVQEMVSSQTSGVMFTCDPVTSSPEIITITANYGLGESVVSASAEPDTFRVRRSSNGELKLDEVIIGKKQSFIEQGEDGGTVERHVLEEDSQKACLSGETAERLSLVGNQIESCFTTPRDIEWALVDDRIFLLQSRPVTSITKETDFEIINDKNGDIKSEDEILSRAIMEEIFPGALSPLGIELVCNLFGFLSREFLLKSKPLDEVDLSIYPNSIMPVVRKHLYLTESGRDMKDPTQKSLIYASYGRDISGEEAVRIGATRSSNRPKSFLHTMKRCLRLILVFFPTRIFDENTKGSKNFGVYQNENLTANQQLRFIVNSILQMGVFSMGLFRAFVETSLFDLFVMNTLARANKGAIDTKVLTATAKLIQAGEIESVDVPLSLQRLGAGLSKSPDKDNFLAMEPDEALKWLMESKTADGLRFREFLQKHGHRSVKEFDVATEPWVMQPTKLIKSLQVAASVPHEPKAHASTDYDLTQLGLDLSLPQRLLLRFLIPKARQAVVNRELAKSALIRAIHKVRLAFNHLAELMVEEGRLPEKNLLFFMELDEIHRLIDTRNPVITARAVRRQRLHDRLDNELYPVLQRGFPKKKEPMTFANTLMELKGTPVCQGIVEGRARVITHFETEAHHIEKNEILITTATDTGWTPYFPILGGVVTETGGLVSHGAVVAREYGLPCAVGIENATLIFSSGDLVRLDGGKGTLQKISQDST